MIFATAKGIKIIQEPKQLISIFTRAWNTFVKKILTFVTIAEYTCFTAK